MAPVDDERRTEVVVGVRVVGFYADRIQVVPYRLVGLPGIDERHPQVVMDQPVGGGMFECGDKGGCCPPTGEPAATTPPTGGSEQ